MSTRTRRFFARFNRFELSAPLVEASSGHPELLGQLIDAFTALHRLYGHALKLPGISLSSLHCCFLYRRVCPSRVCQFKGAFQLKWNLLTPTGKFCLADCAVPGAEMRMFEFVLNVTMAGAGAALFILSKPLARG